MSLTEKKAPFISDFAVLFFIGSILVIDFLPYFQTIEIIHPQFLYLAVINIVMGFYFYFGPKDIVSNNFLILRKNKLALAYLLFVVLSGLSFITAINVSLVIANFTEILIVFLLFVNLSILLKDKLHLFYKITFIICISTFLQSFLELYDVAIAANKSSVIEALGQLKWKTGNINILAASLSIKIPFLLLGITHYSGNKKWFVMITLFLATTTIFLTGARSGLINLFIVFVVYVFYHLKTLSFKKEAFIKVSALLIPLIISILVSNLVLKNTNNIDQRYSSVEGRMEQLSTSDSSIKRRLVMWDIALDLCKKNPVLGIGLGNYRVESIAYEKTTSEDNTIALHAHNDFLEILSETGVVNGLIYFSLFVSIFFINLIRVIKSKDENARTIALITLLLVMVYGIDSMFNFPMYRPTMQIFLSLLFALTIVNKVFEINVQSIKNVFSPSSIIIALSVVTCVASYTLFKASNLEFLIKTDDINSKSSGFLNGDEVIRRLPLFPNVFGSSESYFEYAGIYYLREKRYDDAIKYLNKADKINPYTGRVDFYKHVIYEQTGNIDSAYKYVKKAFYWRPRNASFYNKSISVAAQKKDTLEILKEHKLFSKYTNSPAEWKHTATILQNLGYNRKNLMTFINEGEKKIPNDTVLKRQKIDFMVTDYIIEGQNFANAGKPQQSLQSYEKALKIDPGNIYALQNIGFHYFNTGQNTKAIDYFKSALKKPGLNDGHTEYYIALSYLKINDLNKACEYFKLSKEKNYPQATNDIDKICR
ncbi:MAG: hypothetical protein DI539_23130 [Flavobacterium psychrophilum]|nr:MAG: hypothetical protein DI539_23130 [Flavobacterium psychrophilum]